MKIFYSFIFFLFIINFTNAQEPFITKWSVQAEDVIYVPIEENAGNNFTINFGDGTILTGLTGPTGHRMIIPEFIPLQFQVLLAG